MNNLKINSTLSIEQIANFANTNNLILYGAGTAVSSYARIALWALRALGLEPTIFIDDDESRWGTNFEGIPVCPPSILITRNEELPTILVTSNYFESIFKSLESLGIEVSVSSMFPLLSSVNANHFEGVISYEEVNRRMHTHYAKLTRLTNSIKSSEEIYFNALDIQVTEKCTMKCLDCSNLMQYYSDPKDIPIEEVIENLSLLLNSIDKLADARVIGGEPFLNKSLYKLIDVLVNSEKVDHITIYSNATFVPSKETLQSMSKVKKLHVEFTDYGVLSKGIAKLPDVLKQWDIPYFFHKPQNWTDSSRIFNKELSDDELSQMFEACCVNDALTLLGNRLYHCPFSANLYNISAIDPVATDWIDMNQIDGVNFRTKIKNFYYGQPFLNACRYCAGRDFQQQQVTPAIQVKRFIPIHLRKDWEYVEHNNSNSAKES
jgi:organic radical activating enzyme